MTKNQSWFMGRVKTVHFVGLGGIGMSGLAEILLNLGFSVQGSDQTDGPVLKRLSRLKAKVFIGHNSSHINDADVLVYSTAVPPDNPERSAARRAGIPEIRRAELLAELMRLQYGIAIAGTHGKTTTTSILAVILEAADLDPTVLIGGNANNIGTNARIGKGNYFLAEADESDASFLLLTPAIAVVTNIEEEHMDYYESVEKILETFSLFLKKVPFFGAAVVCGDDLMVASLTENYSRRLITYGLNSGNDVRAVQICAKSGWQQFRVFNLDVDLGEFSIQSPGRHMISNALAAISVALEIGVAPDIIRNALKKYKGVKRRMERKGCVNGILVIDDYAHHPTEIAATLSAVKENWTCPIHVVFQPHRFTRTEYFFDRFADVLTGVDSVLLLPIYAASEPPIPGIDSSALAARCRSAGPQSILVQKSIEQAVQTLKKCVKSGDIVLTLGAGDVFKVGEKFLKAVKK
jgi:UDP-N-acetylmuramate--alanine ligase